MRVAEIFQFTSTECLRLSGSHFSLSMTINDTIGATLMPVLSLCVVQEGSGASGAFLGALVMGSPRLTCLPGTFARMQGKTVAVALTPGVFLEKQAKKPMSKWDHQQFSKFCFWFF